jgi:hypothetical protein
LPIAELGTRKWKLKNRNSPRVRAEEPALGEFQVSRVFSFGNFEETKPPEANGLKTIVVKEIFRNMRNEATAAVVLCHQSLTAILGPVFEKMIMIDGFYIADWGGGGQQSQANPTELRHLLSVV